MKTTMTNLKNLLLLIATLSFQFSFCPKKPKRTKNLDAKAVSNSPEDLLADDAPATEPLTKRLKEKAKELYLKASERYKSVPKELVVVQAVQLTALAIVGLFVSSKFKDFDAKIKKAEADVQKLDEKWEAGAPELVRKSLATAVKAAMDARASATSAPVGGVDAPLGVTNVDGAPAARAEGLAANNDPLQALALVLAARPADAADSSSTALSLLGRRGGVAGMAVAAFLGDTRSGVNLLRTGVGCLNGDSDALDQFAQGVVQVQALGNSIEQAVDAVELRVRAIKAQREALGAPGTHPGPSDRVVLVADDLTVEEN